MILLDTHSLIWWVNHHAELSVTALARIEAERPDGEILISAISAWEVAALAKRRRLGLRMEPAAWLARIGDIPEVRFVPVDHLIAAQSVALPEPFPAGPIEQMLAATARRFGCALVTPSKKMLEYPHIKTIW
jgi:PIN domain nuclease of toxin-antitoxin system